MTDRNRVRNLCIIAHVDHGKSTLADRLLEITETLPKSAMREQVLDTMDLERERGITIKAHPITMKYKCSDGEEYVFNLIDTPGHVDFSYEVSRSLAACEGAVLLVDAAQGVQAQTVSNFHLAVEAGLSIIPAVNKIDLPGANVEETVAEVAELVGVPDDEVLRLSAKHGTGVGKLLERVAADLPPPKGDRSGALKALIFDSNFDSYKGVLAYVRVFEGTIEAGSRARFLANGRSFEVPEVGIFRLSMVPTRTLSAGDVGYLVTGVKDVAEAQVGDTVASVKDPKTSALPGYKPMKSMVFSGMYPADGEGYDSLKEALSKLRLNDAALSYEPETSQALGFGFRCGFLGPLHMEIVQERLEREYGLNLIATIPSVRYRAVLKDGKPVEVGNPSEMPRPDRLDHIEEPYVTLHVVVPSEYVGAIMQLAQESRGIYVGTHYGEGGMARLEYRLPFSEIVLEFYDKIKSASRGYASYDYEFAGYEESDLVKMDILLNGETVDALSAIIHRGKGYRWGREMTSQLRKLIPRQLFEVAIQAAVGGKVVARETISPLRKNVTAKCYGGDITRKRKLLEKQREGKRRMKQIGTVEVPQEAFLAVYRTMK
jgi:GTP-binding protein LepA